MKILFLKPRKFCWEYFFEKIENIYILMKHLFTFKLKVINMLEHTDILLIYLLGVRLK